MPLLLIPEYSGINKEQRIPDRSKTAHRKPPVKCILTSPQATLLTGLGPRPSSSLSWPLPWGCSTEKAPPGGPCCNPSSRMGAAPHSGATAVSWQDTSAPELKPPISHYNHCYSHYDHRSHTHCSHTPLSHTPLPHYDRCSHTMTTSTTVSRRNGMKALPPARLLRARNRNPLSHKGLCGNRGAGLRPTVKGAERGDGLPKRRQVSVGCGRRKAVPVAQAPSQT